MSTSTDQLPPAPPKPTIVPPKGVATMAPPVIPPKGAPTMAPPVVPPKATMAPPVVPPKSAPTMVPPAVTQPRSAATMAPPVPSVRSGAPHSHHIPVSPRISDHSEDRESIFSSKLENGRASIMAKGRGTTAQPSKDTRIPLGNGTLVGQYLIVSLMGEGGFGLTYKAIRQSDNQQVVLKEHMPVGVAIRDEDGIFVTTPDSDSEDYFTSTLDEFRDEISTLIALEHPNIVRIEDFFEANGTAYYVMPLVQGTQMEIPKLAELDPAKRAREARRIKLQLLAVLDAMVYLDQNNVVHRDLKPENIQITPEGQPVILDFGSARQIRPGREYSNMYTPAFCAPEQCASSSDPKWGKLPFGQWTDMYALGACFYYRITRMLPPKAEARILAYPNDPYRPLANRRDLQEIYGDVVLSSIDRALELEPDARWQHAQDWRTYLQQGVKSTSPLRVRSAIPYMVALCFAGLSAVMFTMYLRKNDELETVAKASSTFTTKLLTDVSVFISDLPGTAPLHNSFCRHLADYIHAVEPSFSENPDLLEGIVLGYMNNGINYAEADELERASQTFKLAEDRAKELIRLDPKELRHHYTLARTQLLHADNLYARAEDTEAEKLIDEAISTLKRICKERPQSPDYASTLVQAMLLDAEIESKRGTIPVAEETVRKLEDIIVKTLELYPKHVETLYQRAETLHLRANIAANSGHTADAERYLQEEAEVYDQLRERHPYKLTFLYKQSHITYKLGQIYSQHAVENPEQQEMYLEKAEEQYKNHIDRCHELQRLDDRRPLFIYEECVSLSALQRLLLRKGLVKLAEAYSTQMMRKAERLIDISPQDVNFCCMHATAWCCAAAVHRRSTKTLQQAGKELAKSRQIMEDTLSKANHHLLMLNSYIILLEESTEYELETGDKEAAAKWIKLALEKVQTLKENYPGDPLYPSMQERLERKLQEIGE